MNAQLIIVAGPTSTGKSALAVALAARTGGEIVNADSQQVYRGLDIGTGKPTSRERAGIPHHLFDVADPWDQFDAARFIGAADVVLAAIGRRGQPAYVVGGTGLWIRALMKGLAEAPGRNDELRGRLEREAAERGVAALHDRLREVDPASAERIRSSDAMRIVRALEVFELTGVPLSVRHERHRQTPPRRVALQLALDLPGAALNERIDSRARAMFEGGLLKETTLALADARSRPRLQRVMGYREALAHLEGRMSLDEAVAATALAQRQYARRQRRWFRSEPQWRWLEASSAFDQALRACETWLGASVSDQGD